MNVFDYLRWRGDLLFKQDPFNEVDNLIVSEITYVYFDDCFKGNEKYSLKQLSDIYFKNHEAETKDEEFFKLVSSTNRFKDCVMFNYVSKVDEENYEQFGAFELDLKDGTTYIAFRGTDDTLVGWHEDFMLAYTKINAQEDAYKYLKANLKPFKKYRIGGHSKGGNLAIYASLLLAKKHKRIVKIYSNDGPGLNKDFLPNDYKELFSLIEDKYVKFIPEFDFFGTIFDISRNNVVIKSNATGILQHQGYSWQVEGNGFVKGVESEDSKLIRNAFKDFFGCVDLSLRKEFVEEIFKAFDKAGIKNVADFSKGGFSVIASTIKNFSDMNDESKAVANELIKVFSNRYINNFNKEVNEIKDSASNFIKNIVGKN